MCVCVSSDWFEKERRIVLARAALLVVSVGSASATASSPGTEALRGSEKQTNVASSAQGFKGVC